MPLHNSLSNLLKYDTWLQWAISFEIPYQNHWNITYDCNGQFPLQFPIQIDEIRLMTARGRFLYNSLSKSLQDDLWLLGAINMSCDSYEPFPIQFLIKIIEIWPMAAMSNFCYNSLSKSLKYGLWLPWAISFTTPYQNHWNMTCDCNGLFPLQFLSKPLKYDLWKLWAISITTPYLNHWSMSYDS